MPHMVALFIVKRILHSYSYCIVTIIKVDEYHDYEIHASFEGVF